MCLPGAVNAGILRGTYSTQEFTRDQKTELLQVPAAGTYTIHYSLTSGKGDWARANSQRSGSNFANPLITVTSVDELAPKSLPAMHSFLTFNADNLVVSALKKGPQDGSVILRVFESGGKPASTPVEFLGTNRSFQPVNMLEESTGQKQQQSLSAKPWEISTIQINLK